MVVNYVGEKMPVTKCPTCNKKIVFSYERSVYRPDVEEGEEEHNEIQCPHCDEYIILTEV